MKFTDEIQDYLSGKAFSAGCRTIVSGREKSIPPRMDFIESMVKGKKIIHLGCTDHPGLIDKKIAGGTWFHKRLSETARECLGIDINTAAIGYCRDKLGFQNILYHDIAGAEPLAEIMDSNWDYMVIGELLEHVDNPVRFLQTIKRKYQDRIERLIISAPNAFRLDNFKLALRHTECINSDHRFWFTPYTLAKLVTQAGMKAEEFWFVSGHGISRKALLANILLKKFPALRDTIIMAVAV